MAKKTSAYFFLMVFFSSFLFAQTSPDGRLFVLNEGSFGGEGSIGYIDFQTGIYTEIDKIAAFGNQVTVINNDLYAVTGNGDVYVYDTQTFARKDSLIGRSVRGVFNHNNQDVLLTCNSKPYACIRAIGNLSQTVYNFDTTQVRSAREEAIVYGDKAFLTGYYGDSVVIAVDLVSFQMIKEIQTKFNPYQITEMMDKVYVACYEYDANFNTHTTLYTIDPVASVVVGTKDLPFTDGLTSGDGWVYLKKSNGKVLKYDPVNDMIDSSSYVLGAYSLEYDAQSQLLFYSRTDYATYGQVGFVKNDTVSTTVNTDISPRSFVFIPTPQNPNALPPLLSVETVSLYPNPGKSLVVNTRELVKNVSIFSLSGQKLVETKEKQPDTEFLSEGLYIIRVETQNGVWNGKWMKN